MRRSAHLTNTSLCWQSKQHPHHSRQCFLVSSNTSSASTSAEATSIKLNHTASDSSQILLFQNCGTARYAARYGTRLENTCKPVLNYASAYSARSIYLQARHDKLYKKLNINTSTEIYLTLLLRCKPSKRPSSQCQRPSRIWNEKPSVS